MEISGTVRDGVVILEEGVSLPLVESKNPGSVHLTNERIAKNATEVFEQARLKFVGNQRLSVFGAEDEMQIERGERLRHRRTPGPSVAALRLVCRGWVLIPGACAAGY